MNNFLSQSKSNESTPLPTTVGHPRWQLAFASSALVVPSTHLATTACSGCLTWSIGTQNLPQTHRLSLSLVNQLQASIRQSTITIPRDLSVVPQTGSAELCQLSPSLFDRRLVMALSMIVISRDKAIIKPTILVYIQPLPASVTYQHPGAIFTSMIISPRCLAVVAPTVLVHTCRLSASRVDQLQASAALSTRLSSGNIAIIAPTILAHILRLRSSLADWLPACTSVSIVDSSSGDLPVTARLSASLIDHLNASTAFSTIVISRDVAIIEPTICAHIPWMLSSLAYQLLSSSAPSAVVILRARAIIAPTILKHTH